MSDRDRILKLRDCGSVRLRGHDQHGDFVVVSIEGSAAQEILKSLQGALQPGPLVGASDGETRIKR